MAAKAVCDANVAVFWLVDDPMSETAIEARKRFDLVAPRLLMSEVANALRAYVRADSLPANIAQRHLVNLPKQIELRNEDDLAPLALSLSVEWDQAAYDCFYVAMAMTLGLPLVTGDRRLARKFEAMPGVEFIVLQDWTT